MEVDLLNYEFSLLVLLTGFVCTGIGPSHQVFAPLAKYVAHAVEASYEQPVFGRTDGHIDAVVEEVGTS
jgi:hypothetical protein